MKPLAVARRAVELAERMLSEGMNAEALLVQSIARASRLQIKQGQARDALPLLQHGLALQESMLANVPESVLHQSTLATLLHAYGDAAATLGDSDRACEMYTRAAKMSSTLGATDLSQQYNAACFWALAIPHCPASERQGYVDRAIAALQDCKARGYSQMYLMIEDEDLDILRGRADFRSILAGVEPRTSSGQ